ncbi:hypothetical protein AAX26_00536 [Aliarcobacter thereius]|uniref:Epoxyqueuosine reductase QueH n=2 Tax=Aliarcobacter thereius TaxID=544718 RepID=A0A5R9GW00_9BACT|nr:epoxyqueuosine reductase QueH [Aliarcobacter thereius]OCL87451.1 hypothetical protein AAX26_00536 [Aliarcobacter thereius]OCL94180.1 hypothetical protein AAX25_00518 [Aliarcobacter thereius]OCL95093.1 hypothetical protein AA347_00544 [Aliarcobacter thereius LMG 24486]QBF16917.1 hypothetical protein (DUF208 domain) [Aliarcobacter thereius LMG 24486]TLS70743.1 epoxyqueuosine reductase QueH [Aliarcobacter thereius]
MLVHICCSVDSHYFLEKIKEEYKDEEIVGYFYDPNIHPYSEYRLRYLDVEFSCKKLGIKLFEGDYNLEAWLKKTKGMEELPEKGERCTVCYDFRLENSFDKAIELGHNKVTTTLLISPKKSQEKLEIIGNILSKRTGIEFVFKDYRSGIGMQMQGLRVKENNLYRQNYCGCIYGLSAQREHQKKLMDEMFSPISNQILPESIEQRLELYYKRNKLEENKINYKLIKQKILNYRLFSGKISIKNEVIPSYIFFYSLGTKKQISTKIDFEKDGIFYLNRDEVKLITINTFNKLSNSTYKSTKELMYNPLKIEDEIELRFKILKSYYDLSPIIVLDEVVDEKYDIFINSINYEDIKEEIV